MIGDDGNENAFDINANTGLITVGSNTGSVTGEEFQVSYINNYLVVFLGAPMIVFLYGFDFLFSSS